MYASWFGLSEPPFAITPDPRYLYLSGRHSEALAHLVYGITESGGFLQLTGEVGTGKTTLVRTLLERLPEGVDVALVLNPRQSPLEFVQTICQELHVPVGDATTLKAHVDALNAWLLAAHAAGRRVVVIVDEAQALPPDVLEQLRLLTNLETATHKLLQIVLVGQPELRETLARGDLRQLAQRITARWHLAPLDRRETAAYVGHRLAVAGAAGPIFGHAALAEVHRLADGVPRLINVICDRALLGAFSREQREVDAATVHRAAQEVLGPGEAPSASNGVANRPWLWLMVGAALALAGVALVTALTRPAEPPPATTAVAAPASAAPATTIAPAPTTLPAAPAAAPPTAAPSTAGAPAVDDVAALFAEPGLAVDTDAAFGKLFALWHQIYMPGPEGAACAQATAAGLACHFQQGNWNTLRLLDRPAVLTLELGDGRRVQTVIVGLGERTATLAFGDRIATLPLVELDALWYGESLLLHQMPPHGPTKLRVGDSGAGVLWLRRHLGALRGLDPATLGDDRYDDTLAGWVREFQRERRIKADGVAGAETFLHLDSASPEPGTPRLSAAAP